MKLSTVHRGIGNLSEIEGCKAILKSGVRAGTVAPNSELEKKMWKVRESSGRA